jgi:PAS domain S-box-containing protein
MMERSMDQDRTRAFETLFEASPDAVALLDLEGRIIRANLRAASLVGLADPEALEGRSVFDFLSNEDRERAQRNLEKIVNSGRVMIEEYGIEQGDGTQSILESHTTPVLDDKGRPVALMGIYRDTTPRRRAQNKLASSERKLRGLVERSIDGIVMIDGKGIVVEWSPGQERITGLPASRALSQPIWKVQTGFFPRERRTPEQVELHRRLVEEYLAAGDAPWLGKLLEVEIERTDGTRTHIQSLAFTIRQNGANLTATITRDIGERKRAEKQIETYQEELRHLASELGLAEERERRRIASQLHDEVGQELAAILLELRGCAQQGPECLEDVAAKLEETIRQMRTLTSEISPPILYELGLVAALEWLIGRERERSGIALKFEADELDVEPAQDTRVLLFQSVRELLRNVRKHSGASTASVVLHRQPRAIRITVEDDGRGMDRPSRAKTNGYGLFSIQERVRHMGGNVELATPPGGGIRVSIVLPHGGGQ